MDVAALIAWLATASGGFFLLAKWLAGGGMSADGRRGSRFPPALIFGHAGLAALGLVVWIAFVSMEDEDGFAWGALALLVAVAALGFAMFFRWWADRRGAGAEPALAEQRFPSAVVFAHGLLAVVTVVLVLSAAVEGAS